MKRQDITFLVALTALAAMAGPAQSAPLAHVVRPLRAEPVWHPAPNPHPGHEAQTDARRAMRAGDVHPLRDIEREVLPTMKGMQYLGPEYDADAMAYRLKFIRNGRVSFVDVDARTGQVLGRTR